MHLDHQDNTLQRSLQSFQTNYYISLRNSGIYKQTDKQTVWLNYPTDAENNKFTLLEEGEGTWEIFLKTIPLARNQKSNYILLEIIIKKIYIPYYVFEGSIFLYELTCVPLPEVCPFMSMYQMGNLDAYINIYKYIFI